MVIVYQDRRLIGARLSCVLLSNYVPIQILIYISYIILENWFFFVINYNVIQIYGIKNFFAPFYTYFNK